jgi:RNA polymerase sigma-70 factor (ECF subfamily)
VRDYHDRAEHRYVSAGNDVVDTLPDEEEAIETGVVRCGEMEQMATLLSRLPVHQRETVILRYVEGLSLAEAAEVLDVHVGTVKSRVFLGLSRLRTLMREGEEL